MKITVKMLKEKGACEYSVKLFKDTFGDEVEVTLENCLKAADVGLDIEWAAKNLLSRSQRKAYEDAEEPLLKAYKDAEAPLWKSYKDAKEPLQKAYKDAEAPLRKAYGDAIEPLWEAYKDAIEPLWEAYKDAEAPLRKAYGDAVKPLWKAYKDARARLFFKVWSNGYNQVRHIT